MTNILLELFGYPILETQPKDRPSEIYKKLLDEVYQDIKSIPNSFSLTPLIKQSELDVVALEKGLGLISDDKLAYAYALVKGNPFVLIGADYAKHNLNGELLMYDSVTGKGQLTKTYIEERQKFLDGYIKHNIADGITDSIAYGDGYYFDKQLTDDVTGLVLSPKNGETGNNAKQVHFGGDGIDKIVLVGGGQSYPVGELGAGHGFVFAGSGNDYITLGDGSDLSSVKHYAEGGIGFDTYNVINIATSFNGVHTIYDIDQKGIILFDGIALGLAKSTGTNTWKDEKSFIYKLNGSNLEIKGLDSDKASTLIIKDFFLQFPLKEQGQGHTLGLGITLLDSSVNLDQGPVATAEGNSYWIKNNTDPSLNYGGRANGTNDIDFVFGTVKADLIKLGNDDDYASGNHGADIIYGDGGRDYIVGGLLGGGTAEQNNADNDILIGGDDSDLIAGAYGDDVIYTGNVGEHMWAGNSLEKGDWANGGQGNDAIYGSTAKDFLNGAAGKDLIFGGGGDDVILGDGNNMFMNRIITTNGKSIMDGRVYKWVVTRTGSDITSDYELTSEYYVTGQHLVAIESGVNYDDEIHGGVGNDLIIGQYGDDIIYGDEGDDVIFGDDNRDESITGNDTLDGGAGNNKLYGGNGFDTYIFDSSYLKNNEKNVVLDKDGSGKIILNGKDLNLESFFKTKGIENHWTTVNGLILKLSGSTLTLSSNKFSGTVEIQQFSSGDLGLDLNKYPEIEENPDNGGGTDPTTPPIPPTPTPPKIANQQADLSFDEKTAIAYQFSVDLFSGADAASVVTRAAFLKNSHTFSFQVLLADGTPLPAWLSFDPDTLILSGMPENDHVGDLQFKIIATDSNGLSAEQSFKITVNNVNDVPLVVGSIDDIVIKMGDAINWSLPTAIFKDIDKGDVLSYSVSLADGSALPSWLHFDPVTGLLSGIPSKGHTGDLSIKVTATDTAGANVSTYFGLSVEALPNGTPTTQNLQSNLSLDQDQVWSYQLSAALFSDPDGDVLQYRVVLADGNPLPSWLHFDPDTRTLSGTPDNDQVGDLQLKIIATDQGDLSAEQSFNLTVNNVNDAPIVVGGIDDIVIKMGEVINWSLPTAIFKDIDKADILSYSVSLADGSALPSWLHFDPVTGLLSGTPSKGHTGDLSIKVTATDKAGANVGTYFGLSVEALPNGTPTTQNLQSNLSLDQDQVWSYQLSAALFSDPDGDILQYRVVLADGNPLPSWLHFDPDTRTLSGTPDNDQVGDLQLKIIATDQGGLSAEQSFNLTVNNVNDAPIANGVLNNQSGRIDELWQFDLPVGSFTDIDKNDRLSYSLRMTDGSEVPAWLKIDATIGKISGKPNTLGLLNLQIVATDLSGAEAIHTLKVDIKGGYNPGDIVGTDGNDTLTGTTGNNVIYGLGGDDRLTGGTGSDTYVFAKGHGQDVIYDYGYSSATETDTLIFTDVNSTEVKFGRSGNNLILFGYNGADKITIEQFFTSTPYSYAIEVFQFADKTITYDQYMAQGLPLYALDETNAITGWTGANIIHAGSGIKTINTGDADDVIYTETASTTVNAGNGNDIIYSGSGNDRLIGSNGSDTYIFAKGHGQDVIYDYGYSSATETDTLIFTDVNSTEVKFGRSGNNLILFGYNGADKITIEQFFTSTPYSYAIEVFQFADKTITYDQYMAQGLPLYALDETNAITGWAGANIIHAGSGTKTITTNNADDVIYTETASATVNAGNGNDIIYSGSGNDRLIGSNGSDTYIFAKGHGQDVIYDYGYSSATETDTLIFTDVNSTEVKFGRSGNNLILFGYNGADKITIEQFFTSTPYSYAIEVFQFADKTITYDDYMTQGLPLYVLDETSVITGWTGANIIHAGSGTKTINTGDANDVIYTETANATVNAGNGNDTIYSGSGNDRLIGSNGSDTYIFAKGHGQDVIYDYGYSSAKKWSKNFEQCAK